ncbi:sodium:solute symporter family protein [bacterium]|nr:sodium:solute symporter family protein [bacterium]
MFTKLGVLAGYFLIVLAIGFAARRVKATSASEFFLAGRTLGTFILICTLAATNFSAFTVFGCSGAGYRDGLAFFPVMAFGTGFMALTFWLIGRKVWQLGREHGLVTPAELIGHLYRHRGLSLLFAVVMIVWTVPYLALQPLAGGLVLNGLFNLPQMWGALIITAVIVLYTLHGGLKAVAWTDAFQGLLMLVMLFVALGLVIAHHGGLAGALSQVMAESPAHFSRPGGTGYYLPGVWFSMILLWFFCDPMFPQLFQRFYAAKNERALSRAMLVYPVVTTLAFAPPILLGVLGTLSFPGLEGKAADNIVPLLMTSLGGDLMGTLILTAGLAALMSTMDSQLLTLSSIFTRDVLPWTGLKTEGSPWPGRAFIVVLAAAGLLIAVNPPASIVKIGFTAFTGLAALFPTVLFGLYLKRPSAPAAIVSILAGQGVLLAYVNGWLTAVGFLPALPVMIVSTVLYLAVQLAASRQFALVPVSQRSLAFGLAFTGLFILAMDFWNWHQSGPLLLGLPYWLWYSIGLSALQVALAMWMLRTKSSAVLAAPGKT